VILPAEHVDTNDGVTRNDIPLCHFIKHLTSRGSTWGRGAQVANLGSVVAVVWPPGAWSSLTEVSSTDSAVDSVEMSLSEIGRCTARTLDAAASSSSQGRADGAARQAMAVQQQLEGVASLAMGRWCLWAALADGAAGEEHGGSRGGRRAKCDDEKANVKFASMMEVAQGIWTVQKPWADARGGDTRWAATVGQHSAGAVGVERSWGARTVKDFAQRPWARPSRVASGQFQMDLGRTVPMDRAR
jgi:hypothetical protein